MAPKKATTKARLNRDRIVQAAIHYADKNGIDRLNMRSLAKALSCPVMSLYTYVQNKDELMDAMVESVAEEIFIPEDDIRWREALSTIAASACKAFFKHPWAIGLWNTAGGPAKMAHQESILRVLREAGFSVRLACRGYHAITMHTIGFTAQALDFPRDAKSMKAAAGTFLADADPKAIPYFIEHVKHHQDHPESDGEFEFVLDMILDGLEKHLETS